MLMGRRQALGPVVPRQLRDSAPRHSFPSTRFLLLASRPAEPFGRLGSVRLDALSARRLRVKQCRARDYSLTGDERRRGNFSTSAAPLSDQMRFRISLEG